MVTVQAAGAGDADLASGAKGAGLPVDEGWSGHKYGNCRDGQILLPWGWVLLRLLRRPLKLEAEAEDASWHADHGSVRCCG